MSSLLAANGPTRRLLCGAYPRKNEVIVPQLEVAILGHDGFQRRQYVYMPNADIRPREPAPRVSPPRLAGQGSTDSSRRLFSAKDVPPPKEWLNSLESLRIPDLTPMQCVDAALKYVEIATPAESRWRGDLEKHKLPPSLLHSVGLALVSSHSQRRWRLGTHMMRSASELGYPPSTLTLMRIFTSMPPPMFQKASTTIIYREAYKRFHALLQKGTDPNSFTLQGLIAAAKGNADREAMAMFVQAEQVWQKENSSHGSSAVKTDIRPSGTRGDTQSQAADPAASQAIALPPPREPRWEWEISNVLGQARICIKKPQTSSRAQQLFRVAALELDNPHGFLMLAKLMGGPRDTPARRTYLVKAAVSGEREACLELGELEKQAAAAATSRQDRTERELMSREWFRLGAGEDLSASVKAVDVDEDTVS